MYPEYRKPLGIFFAIIHAILCVALVGSIFAFAFYYRLDQTPPNAWILVLFLLLWSVISFICRIEMAVNELGRHFKYCNMLNVFLWTIIFIPIMIFSPQIVQKLYIFVQQATGIGIITVIAIISSPIIDIFDIKYQIKNYK